MFLNTCDSNVFCFVFLSCRNIILLIFLLNFNFLCTFTLFAFIIICLIKFSLFVLVESFILIWTLFMFYCLLFSLLLSLLWCSLVLLFCLLNWNPNSSSLPDLSDISLLKSFLMFWFNRENCADDVMFGVVLVLICCRKLSTLF